MQIICSFTAFFGRTCFSFVFCPLWGVYAARVLLSILHKNVLERKFEALQGIVGLLFSLVRMIFPFWIPKAKGGDSMTQNYDFVNEKQDVYQVETDTYESHTPNQCC